MKLFVYAAAVTALVAASVPAELYAKGHPKGDKHSVSEYTTGNGKSNKGEANNDAVSIAITMADRLLIRQYLQDNVRSNCPPGLAKKQNGCLPPGIAKKYHMGQALPAGVGYKSLPSGLLGQLHPMPGYRFVQVDQDVLLIAEAGKKVIDAVTLLSAVK